MKFFYGFVATALKIHTFVALSFFALPVSAQTELCNESTIELIVPWAAGGGTDAHARLVAQPLSEHLGQNIVVLNRPGAGGVVGTTHFVNTAKPDGCTLIMMTGATNTAAPYVFGNLKFEPLDDFTPIAFVASAPNVLYVHKDSPYQSVDDVISDAKNNPGKIAYASGGIGASSHLAGAWFTKLTDVDMMHVPYQGAGPAMAALIADQIDLSLDTGAQARHVTQGSLRALAVAAEGRLAALPDVPTFDEVGIPGFYYSFWSGIAGPRDLPVDMVNRLNKAINKVISAPKIQERFHTEGNELKEGMTPEEFEQFWRSELERNKKIVELTDARAE